MIRIAVIMLTMSGLPSPGFSAAMRAPPGATSCSGCHSSITTTGGGIAPLAGRDAGELQAALLAFRSGDRPATVMNRIAKGFSPEELAVLAKWFAAQK
jgi:sulfide dehydrogenase cytochrome subunit